MDDSKTPHSALDLLLGYLARGWALVPLHDVFYGHCSCQTGQDCKSAGKHPRYPRWQEEGQLIRDGTVLTAVLQAHPEWNWGVATGAASGIWVLDVDGEPGADALAELCFEHGAQAGNVGMWMNTLALGPTGGRGVHYVFALPPDFEVRGSQTRNRYGLPPGLDVRGHHGQIVVAPSVSGKGPYGATLIDAPVRRAPSWLEEMLRPQPDTQPVEKPHDRSDDFGQSRTVPDARALAYARSAVAGALRELAEAPEGTRNDAAYRVACRLHELANAPWSGYDESVLLAAWWDSRWWHEVGRDSADGVWRRARERVAGAAAILPPDYGTPETIPILDFPAPRADGASPGGALETSHETSLKGSELLFHDPMRQHETAVQPPIVSPFEQEVGRQQLRLLAAEEARRRIDVARLGDLERAVTELEAVSYDTAGLDALPRLEPLIEGMLWRNTFARIIGSSSGGKSFTMIDMAGHVGTGTPWAKREVLQGTVVYLMAEGAFGAKDRVRAWEQFHGQAMKNVHFLSVPVQATSARWEVFIEYCRRKSPVLVVGDTQARITEGEEENSSTAMGLVVAAMERLREATQACVVLVHHTGTVGERARGSNAIFGALQTELSVTRTAVDRLEVRTRKQKDHELAEPVAFELREVEHGPKVPFEVEGKSLVLVLDERPAVRLDITANLLHDEQIKNLAGELARFLRELGADAGLTAAQVAAMVVPDKIGKRPNPQHLCSKPTFYRAWQELMELRVIGNIPRTQRWRYLSFDERKQIVEPVNGDLSGKSGYVVPLATEAAVYSTE